MLAWEIHDHKTLFWLFLVHLAPNVFSFSLAFWFQYVPILRWRPNINRFDPATYTAFTLLSWLKYITTPRGEGSWRHMASVSGSLVSMTRAYPSVKRFLGLLQDTKARFLRRCYFCTQRRRLNVDFFKIFLWMERPRVIDGIVMVSGGETVRDNG